MSYRSDAPISELNYISWLQAAFVRLHGCEASHVETVHVRERWKGETIWEGNVEVFDLIGHPKARRGYAWACDKDKGSDTVAVLALPPVNSPATAVKAALVGMSKGKGAVYKHYFNSTLPTWQLEYPPR